MYCNIIFGENEERHTKCYIYECDENVNLGEIVVVPTKDTTKIAMVHSIFETVPDKEGIDIRKIKRIMGSYVGSVDGERTESFLLAMIDEYKDGIISKTRFNEIIEHFVSSSTITTDKDSTLYKILYHLLPDTCLFYVVEPGDEATKELGFWKGLKDIEYLLRYGHSFWDSHRIDEEKREIKNDPIEYSDEYLKIELELERLIRKEIGDGGYMGFCHKYWYTKKNILKNKFGIEWKSPVDLNRGVNFD